MDRLAPLNAFIHAAESRSFTAAGRELGISASAVGKAVARLEERLGVRLFHRSTRSIALTTEGELFFRRCQRIFGELEAAELELAQSSAAPRGRLRVSLPMIGMLMVPSLAGFARAWPEVELELDFTDRLVDVIDEGLDVVIRTGRATDSRLRSRQLGTYGYVIVGAPSYFDRHGIPQTPEDLKAHACLHHRWSATGKLEQWVFTRDGMAMDIEIPVSIVVNTMEPLIQFAEHGLGLMYTPIFTVRRQLADGTLRPVLDTYLHSLGSLQLLFPASRQQSPKIKVFIDYMVRHLMAPPS